MPGEVGSCPKADIPSALPDCRFERLRCRLL